MLLKYNTEAEQIEDFMVKSIQAFKNRVYNNEEIMGGKSIKVTHAIIWKLVENVLHMVHNSVHNCKNR